MVAVLLAAARPGNAEERELKVSERPPDAESVVALYEGTAPGSEAWAWKEQLSLPPWGARGGRLVRNIVQPTLVVFPPPNKARASRTPVIVAPGGGFQWLSIDSEGYDVARALAARGVTALVLKYRLQHTPDDEEAPVAPSGRPSCRLPPGRGRGAGGPCPVGVLDPQDAADLLPDHRGLLGALSLAAYETVNELMAAAVEEKGFRPGMVSVVQTFGEGAKFHPHVHALCSRGGWAASGEWIPCRMGMRERPRSSSATRCSLCSAKEGC